MHVNCMLGSWYLEHLLQGLYLLRAHGWWSTRARLSFQQAERTYSRLGVGTQAIKIKHSDVD